MGNDRAGSEDSRSALKALADVVVLAEPLLLRLWKSSRVTLGHLRVLRALRQQSRSAGELAGLVGMAPPTMARTLARLEERGLISRSIDLRDRRRIEVALTPRGEALLNTSSVFRGGPFERATAALTDEEARRLTSTLHQFVELVRSEAGRDGESEEAELPA